MTDRPDPFDDLEFEADEEVPAEVAAPQLAAAVAAAPAAAQTAATAVLDPAAPAAQAGPGKLVAYATLAASALAFAGTISVVVVTVATAKPQTPPVSPERATLARIEGLLNSQQRRLSEMAETPSAAPAPGGADLAALSAVVRANQQSIDQLPSLLKQEVSRIRVPAASARPVVVTRAAPAPALNLNEVMRTQQSIQRQLDALAGKMAKTAAACTTQNDGQIRYP